MPDPLTDDKALINIGIGEYYASRDGVIIHTVLGSCVAVCLRDPENKIGGMNHIFMPGEPQMGKYDASARYGVNAMELLINGIMKLGGKRKNLVAKTFGGGNVIASISKETAVGQKIIDFVIDFLSNEKIKIVSRDFGGTDTRKVYFHSDTGEVFLKRINAKKSMAALEKKRLEYLKKQVDEPGDVTLF